MQNLKNKIINGFYGMYLISIIFLILIVCLFVFIFSMSFIYMNFDMFQNVFPDDPIEIFTMLRIFIIFEISGFLIGYFFISSLREEKEVKK